MGDEQHTILPYIRQYTGAGRCVCMNIEYLTSGLTRFVAYDVALALAVLSITKSDNVTVMTTIAADAVDDAAGSMTVARSLLVVDIFPACLYVRSSPKN